MNLFVKQNDVNGAINVFNRMKTKGQKPGVFEYNNLMTALVKLRRPEKVTETFREMIGLGIRPTLYTFNILINSCSVDGDVDSAKEWLRRMKEDYGVEPNIASYNSVLKTCAVKGDISAAREIFDYLRNSERLRPDPITVNALLNAYSAFPTQLSAGEVYEECQRTVNEMEAGGFKMNLTLYNSMLKLVTRACGVKKALSIFQEMKQTNISPNIVSYTTLIDALSEDKRLSTTEVAALLGQFKKEMRIKHIEPNAFTYTSFIKICLVTEDLIGAFNYFRQMKKRRIRPTIITYAVLIKCCERLGDLSDREEYLRPIRDLVTEVDTKRLNPSYEYFSALIGAFGRAGDLDSALRTWRSLEDKGFKPKTYIMNSMICASLLSDRLDTAFRFLTKMETDNINRNQTTWHLFFRHFIHKRKINRAAQLRDRMIRSGTEITPKLRSDLEALNLSVDKARSIPASISCTKSPYVYGEVG